MIDTSIKQQVFDVELAELIELIADWGIGKNCAISESEDILGTGGGLPKTWITDA